MLFDCAERKRNLCFIKYLTEWHKLIKTEAAVSEWPYIFQAYRWWVFSQLHILEDKISAKAVHFYLQMFVLPEDKFW